jgi:hypothetical protein
MTKYLIDKILTDKITGCLGFENSYVEDSKVGGGFYDGWWALCYNE